MNHLQLQQAGLPDLSEGQISRLKAEHAHQRLLLVVQGLKKLFADENFVTLLRAEGLDTLPKYLAERITHFEGAPA